MTSLTTSKRILALDVRPRSFGYVVLEGPDQLLDWGVRSYRKAGVDLRLRVKKSLRALLGDFVPSGLTFTEFQRRGSRRNARLKRVFDAIRREADKQGIPLRPVSRKAVQEAFAQLANATKHRIASVVAERYPELSWKLPPKRKPWQSEDYRMSIFDAAALGVTYFERTAPKDSSAPPGNQALSQPT
jgi:hypothetical protein